MLIRIRVAKERLYEAKVGIIELQTRWDKPGHGGLQFFKISYIIH